MAPPVNDDFANRIALAPPAGGSTTFDTTEATRETGEPTDVYGTGLSVWFEFTCPVGATTLTLQADDDLPVNGYVSVGFALYTGSSVGALTLVAADAGDLGVGGLTVGTVYKLQVVTFPGDAGPSGFSWAAGDVPANDAFADRVAVTDESGTDGPVLLTGASYEDPEDAPSDLTAWWEWTCPDPAPASVAFSVTSDARFGGWQKVYTGSVLADLVEAGIETVDGWLLDSPVAGVAYPVLVYTSSGKPGSVTLAWEGTPADPDPGVVEDEVWSGLEDEGDVPDDVPAAEDVGDGRVVLRRVSETYGAPPSLNNGHPVGWLPDVVEEDWGYVGYQVDGVSVTRVRGIPTVMPSLDLQDPFGEGPMQLLVQGVTEFDIDTDDFDWLAAEKNVDVVHHAPNGTYVRTLWSGVVRSIEPAAGGWSLDCMGAFAGVAGLVPHRPKLVEVERDIGQSIVFACRRATHGTGRRKNLLDFETGIITRDRGARSETLLEYVSRLLGMAQTADGDALTIGRGNTRREYVLRWKQRLSDGPDVTVSVRGRGIKASLRSDLDQVERQIFGEGVDDRGGRWRGTKLPNVGKETIPPYPGTPLDIGSESDSVEIWQMEMTSDGYRTGTPNEQSPGVFGATDAAAAAQLQAEAGLPVTGVVDEDTWDATWSNGDTDLNLGGAYFEPIAADRRTIPWKTSSNGSAIAANDDYDRSLLPLGRFASFGQNVDKAQAARWSRVELAQAKNPSWYGQVSIDLVDPEEMSRLDIREGMVLRLRWWGGTEAGMLLHIAGVHWSRSGPSWSVTLDVSQRRLDRLTLAQIFIRNREARQDPHRRAIAQLRRSAQPRDTPAVWDSEGGFGVLPRRDAAGGTWNIYKVAGGQYGSLSRIRLATHGSETRFAVALFGDTVTAAYLNAVVPAPFADPGDDYRLWDKPEIKDGLRDHLFIEAFGYFKNRGGYSPGYETHPDTGNATGHPVTGVMDVEATTDYALQIEPILWVAVWAEDDCSIAGQLYLLPNE